MNGANSALTAVQQLISIVTHWARLLASLCLSLIVLCAMAELIGYHVPYLHVTPDQALAYLIAACAFALR